MHLFLALLLTAAAPADLMEGKTKTDRTIVAETEVNAPPAEVFALWTTPEGATKFFGPQAKIDPRVGGEYTLIFAPKVDPEGDSYGTKGARILEYDPPRKLSFEWITFTADALKPGVPGPPAIPAAERNAKPLPTWVELTFEPLDGGTRTRVHLKHFGFGTGGKWEGSYAFFDPVWRGVLEQLSALYPAPRPAS